MAGLLDYIFDNVDIDTLDRGKVLEYTAYISEIEGQSLPLDKKIKFLAVKISLQHRLIKLDMDRINNNNVSIYGKRLW